MCDTDLWRARSRATDADRILQASDTLLVPFLHFGDMAGYMREPGFEFGDTGEKMHLRCGRTNWRVLGVITHMTRDLPDANRGSCS